MDSQSTTSQAAPAGPTFDTDLAAGAKAAAAAPVVLETSLDPASARLLGDFAAWCVKKGYQFALNDTRDAVFLSTSLGLPAVVQASPSMIAVQIVYPFDVADDEQQAEAVEHLLALAPIGDELSVLGGYESLPGPAVGMRLLLPMPFEFNEQLMLEAIYGIDDHESRVFGKGGPLADFLPKDEAAPASTA